MPIEDELHHSQCKFCLQVGLEDLQVDFPSVQGSWRVREVFVQCSVIGVCSGFGMLKLLCLECNGQMGAFSRVKIIFLALGRAQWKEALMSKDAINRDQQRPKFAARAAGIAGAMNTLIS